MAEAEITIKENDDLLREITQEATKKANKTSSLRPRGSAGSRIARGRFPVENNVFDSCQHCHKPLAGCVSEGSEGTESSTTILTCGHVLCETCREQCVKTRQEIADDRPLLLCLVCREYGSANILPSPVNVNLSTCQASYCTGELFSAPQYRCVPCQRHICDGCKDEHAERFPGHELIPRPSHLINTNRPFTGCAAHQEPVTSRCNCGEMLCDRCPFNYTSHVPRTSTVVMHRKTLMEGVELELEDAMEDSIGTVSRIRAMRSAAQQKRAELEETMDNVANEVAIHFNQIIIQAIQRCFDVLSGLKSRGAAQHDAIEEHIKMLDKTERQFMMGVEMDERGRDSSLVTADSVSQYVRSVAYGLCKPALEQFEESKDYSRRLEEADYQLTILRPDTKQIMEKIARWGDAVSTNLADVSRLPQETRLGRTPIVEAVSILPNGGRLRNILGEQPIVAADTPLRLHTALDHFTDLYERRFRDPSMLAENGGGQSSTMTTPRREMPFQLGEREPPEARMTEQERKERRYYEVYMQSRPEMSMMQPKIFGGFRRILNLQEHKDMAVKEVQGVYARTPCIAPIWMADGEDSAAITPLRTGGGGGEGREERTKQQQLQHQQQNHLIMMDDYEDEDEGGQEEEEEEGSRSTPHSGGDSRPTSSAAEDGAAAAAADDEDDDAPQLLQQQQQQKQPKVPAVLRKRNLLFVKRPEPGAAPAGASASGSPKRAAAAAATATATVTSTSMHALSSIPGASFQNRLTSSTFPSSAPKKTFFRPATNAERAAVGAPPPLGSAARPPVVRPVFRGSLGSAARPGQQQPHHLSGMRPGGSPMNKMVRLVPATQLLTQQSTEGVVNRYVKDANGAMRVIRGSGVNATRVVARPPPPGYPIGGGVRGGTTTTLSTILGKTTGMTSSTSQETGRLFADKDIKTEEPEEGQSFRVSTVRVTGGGTAENRMAALPDDPQQRREELREEDSRRQELRTRGFRESEIERVILNERSKRRAEEVELDAFLAEQQKNRSLLQQKLDETAMRPRHLQYIVNPQRGRAPAGRLDLAANVPAPRFGSARGSMAEAQSMSKKGGMLPIEKAFTSMFGADGSIIPEWNLRRRGRPAKDDPTAPSNILEQFRKHTTQWPPKFDEMDDDEIAELQDLIDQLDAASRDEEEGIVPLFDNGLVKSEEEDTGLGLVSPWQNLSQDDREKIKAAAMEKLQGAKPEGAAAGCFVCALVREHENKPRTWQCGECVKMGRALTPVRDGAPPAAKKPRVMYNISAPAGEPEGPEEPMGLMDEMMEGTMEEEEGEGEMGEERVEKRGRKKKEKRIDPQKDPDEVRAPREPRKRRETIEAHQPTTPSMTTSTTQPEEDAVVGTTRRGRQIKKPSHLRDYDSAPLAPAAARRSPSAGLEAPEPAVPAALPPVSARSTPRAAKKKEELKEVKEESPEPRSEMDAPKKGAKRGGRH